MKRRGLDICVTIVMVAGMLLCSGCSIEKTDGNKVKDLEFAVLQEEKIPEELKEQIEEKKQEDFKLTYENAGKVYIVRGYGEQETGGYSIAVRDVYLTKNAVCFASELIGPGENEDVVKSPCFPYVVVEVASENKNVVFE